MNQPVAVIAGNGLLPSLLCHALLMNGTPFHVFAIESENVDLPETVPSISMNWGEIGKLWSNLKNLGIKKVVFAGGVKQRPDYRRLRIDFGTLATLPEIISALVGGDDGVLRGVANIFQRRGYELIGAHELCPQLLAESGYMGKIIPPNKILNDLEDGFRIAKGLGALDVGQAAIVENGRALALEGAEGTADMIARVCVLRRTGRLSPKGGGVLVKTSKPMQDLRFDMPAIGVETIEQCSKAKLTAIGVEAERTMLLDRSAIISAADKNKIALYGFPLSRSFIREHDA